MPKTSKVDSGPVVESPGDPSPAKRQEIANCVNAIVQCSIRLTLLAATNPCKCSTCLKVRSMAPHVSKILELGEKVAPVKRV